MSGRLALKSALAFCLALGVGRLLLPSAPAPRASKQAAAGAPREAPVMSVAAASQSAKGNWARTPGAPPLWTVDRELKLVDGGMQNQNVRLTHRISNQYTEGTYHTAPLRHGATARWVPLAQELCRGSEAVAVVKAEPSRAAVEQANGYNRMLFPSTYPDTDERMYVRRDGGVEHDIILKRPLPGMDDSYGLAYSGRLQLSPGLTLWDGERQITGPYNTKRAVQIKEFCVDKEKGSQVGETVFCLRPPVAWDASVALPDGNGMDEELQSVKPRAATACEYRFDFDDAGVKLAVVTPGRWLADQSRVYPVTIDPNLGPFGLADGNPPIYTGTAGTDTIIPVNSGGQLLALPQNNTCPGKPDDGYGTIRVPFAFEYYGVVYPANSPLFVHIDGFASWDDPGDGVVACQDPNNMPIPTPGYPDNAYFAYWTDLRFSTIQGSGIYWYVDGTAPSRRLVIEWYKMAFVNVPGNNYISFNLVLYECDNKIGYTIGQADETDPGFASVGIEDPTGAIGIQYDFNSAVNGQLTGLNNQNNNNANNLFNNLFNNLLGGWGGGAGWGLGAGWRPNAGGAGAGGGAAANTTSTIAPISPGTSLVFQRSAIGFVVSTPTGPLDGCIPHTVCWKTQVTVPVSTCSNGQTVPTSFGFQWAFGDNSSAFTGSACHTWVVPGSYNVTLTVSDEIGNSSVKNFTVKVCDVPEVSILANPQGGTAPLVVNLQAYAASPTTQLSSSPQWTVDRMGAENNPGQFLTIGIYSGNPVSVLFDSQGLFRVTATYSGTDTSSGLDTTGVGTVFIYVAAPTQKIEDSLLITSSKFTIDWTGKYAKTSDSKVQPVSGGAPSNPENDTLAVTGFISLPGVQTSDLMGKHVQVILNGADAILDATFGADGKAIQPAQDNGRTGEFDISLPSGAFTCNVKRSLFWQLGVSDGTKNFLLPAFFRVQIENLYPPLGVPGGLITYSYNAKGFSPGPPPSGKGAGSFKLGAFAPGKFASGVPVPADFGNPGGQEVLLTGAFMVLRAKIELLGNSVFADLKGKLARYGGDSLRPQDNSNVIVSLGGWSEALNFSTTAGFKASGKVPRQRFTFKRSKTLGQTGVASLLWANQAGDFRIQTYALPNELVGLNSALGVQALTAGLTITPDGGQVYEGQSTFQVIKTSATDFVK